jgi:hypothetical protein
MVLAGVWAFFAACGIAIGAGVGAYNLQTFGLEDSDLGARLSTSAGFTALLMLTAAAMAWSLTGVDRSSREPRWRMAAIAFALFGFEELLGIHTWLQDKGVIWGLCYLPLLAFGAVAFLRAQPIFRRQEQARRQFSIAAVLWIAGGVADNVDYAVSRSSVEAIEMAAAILFVLALLARLRHLAREYYVLDEHETRLSIDQIAVEMLGRLRMRPLVIGLPLVMAALATQYVLLHTGNYHDAERIPILDLNNELTLSDVFQGTLLATAGGLALVISKLSVTRAEARRWWRMLGLVMVPLGAEQVLAIHSRFQDATGLPGQVVLVPIAIVAALAWSKVLLDVWDNRLVRVLFIAGAAFWLQSQVSDVLLNPVNGLRWTITPEETGESLGSALWLFSFLVWMRSVLPVEPRPLRADAAQPQVPAPGHQAV